MKEQQTYCGFIAIIGKTNVGKSTLLNKLVGKNISIIANRSETTRNNILGVKTVGNKQAIYIDTPGINIKEHGKLNKIMNKAARSAYIDPDLILLVIDGMDWDSSDEIIINSVLNKTKTSKVLLLINKLDLIKDPKILLPKIDEITKKYNFLEVVPISILQGTNLNVVTTAIWNNLPLGSHHFDAGTHTDRSLLFLIAEKIREILIKNLQQELPYVTNVQIIKCEHNHNLYKIYANIWVEKLGQKKIIIGKNGVKLKSIGTQARLVLEKFLNCKVYLNLLVQVKHNWTNNDNYLKDLNSQ